MKIAVASGKGGTGKTLVAVNLFQILEKGTFVDCDVEEPNANLILKNTVRWVRDVVTPKPVINPDLCKMCGKCAESCRFHALVEMIDKIYLTEDLCHGCGLCSQICPENAITESNHVIGKIYKGDNKNGKISFYQGNLEIGQAMASPVIKDLIKNLPNNTADPIILDTPPGTACPVVTTLSESDYVILVTEPTPYSFQNLKQTIDVLRILGKPFGIILNKSQPKFDELILNYVRKENINLLMKIPFEKRFAETYSEGFSLIDKYPDFHKKFQNLYEKIKRIKN